MRAFYLQQSQNVAKDIVLRNPISADGAQFSRKDLLGAVNTFSDKLKEAGQSREIILKEFSRYDGIFVDIPDLDDLEARKLREEFEDKIKNINKFEMHAMESLMKDQSDAQVEALGKIGDVIKEKKLPSVSGMAETFVMREAELVMEKRQALREKDVELLEVKAQLACAEAEAREQRKEMESLQNELERTKTELVATRKEVYVYKEKNDGLKLLVDNLRDDVGAYIKDYARVSQEWEKQRCQWTKELHSFKQFEIEMKLLAEQIIEQTNAKLRADVLAKNSSLHGQIGLLEIEKMAKEHDLISERKMAKDKCEKLRERLHQTNIEVSQTVLDVWQQEAALIDSLRQCMAEFTDVFGAPVSYNDDDWLPLVWKNLKRVLFSGGNAKLAYALEVFLRGLHFEGSPSSMYQEQVWKMLSDHGILQEKSKASVWSWKLDDKRDALQNWCTHLHLASWTGANEDLSTDLRKLLRLDHKWKKYSKVDVRPVSGHKDTIHRSKEAMKDKDTREDFLIERVHDDRAGYCGFIMGEGDMAMEMLPLRNWEDRSADVEIKVESGSRDLYYWAHEDDHKKVEEKVGGCCGSAVEELTAEKWKSGWQLCHSFIEQSANRPDK